MPNFNDLDLKNWRDSDIWTDSLWIIQERDKTGKHDGFYHGNFVPQIPRQLIKRYTKDKYEKGKWIPLGFYCMNEAYKLGLILKSVIVKNMEGNRAKQNKEVCNYQYA